MEKVPKKGRLTAFALTAAMFSSLAGALPSPGAKESPTKPATAQETPAKIELPKAILPTAPAGVKAPKATAKAEPPKATAKAEPPKATAKAEPPKATGTTKSKSKLRTKIGRASILVPPPPPEVPLISPDAMSHDSLFNGVPVEYLSLPDLERLRKKVQRELEATRKSHSEQQADQKDRRTRATQFVELFKEGVVSRKELETAKREQEDGEKSMTEADNKLSELTFDLEKINKQKQKLESQDKKNNSRSSKSEKTSKNKEKTASKPKADASAKTAKGNADVSANGSKTDSKDTVASDKSTAPQH